MTDVIPALRPIFDAQAKVNGILADIADILGQEVALVAVQHGDKIALAHVQRPTVILKVLGDADEAVTKAQTAWLNAMTGKFGIGGRN